MIVIFWLLDLQLHMQSVPITNNVVSSNSAHGEVHSIQHYVIKFVSDLRQVGGILQILRFPPLLKRTAMIYNWNIVESGVIYLDFSQYLFWYSLYEHTCGRLFRTLVMCFQLDICGFFSFFFFFSFCFSFYFVFFFAVLFYSFF